MAVPTGRAVAGFPSTGNGSIAPARIAAAGSDFNGDGFADQAIGAFHETVGSTPDAGAVNVLYGTAAGLQADAPDDQFLTPESFGGGSEGFAQFGWAVATGDFNGDGFDDLAIGVPFGDVGSIADGGAIWVVYGSAAGLVAASARRWTQDSPGVKGVTQPHAAFGRSLSVGDVNGDGFADLAIGSRKEDVGHATDAGAVEVMFGSPAGIQAVAPDDELWTQDSPGVKDTAEAGDWFGRVTAAGDWNHDGFDDLAIGVPFEDVPGGTNAGAVEVLYGSAGGLQAFGPDDQFWTQDSPGVQDRAEGGDTFGHALVAADFNGDGIMDLAIGVRKEDVGSIRDAGAVEVLYGTPGGLQADLPEDQFWTQASPGMHDRAETGDWFGRHLDAGDLNGDGYADLAVGVTYEDVGTVVDAGAVAVLYGSPQGLQDTGPDDQFWTQDSPGVKDRPEAGDWFGRAVAVHDFNADGFGDLAVGVRSEDLGTAVDAGAVEVLYGTAGGLQARSPDDQFWTQDSPGVKDRAGPGDGFGWGLDETGSNGG